MTEKENTGLTPRTTPQKPHGVYPETQTYTPHSETESTHTHPLDSITIVPTTLSHTWTTNLPRELEKDGCEHEVLQKDKVLLQTTAVTFEPTAVHTSDNPYDNTTTYLDLNTSGTESDQILFHPETMSLPAKLKTEATPTPTQLSPEDNRDESKEKISSEDEQIRKRLQVTTPSKITEDQAKLFEINTLANTHTTTKHLSQDEEVTDTESQDEEEHSDEDNLQTSAEIPDRIAGHTTALNDITITPMTSHLLLKNLLQHIEVKADTQSQATSTLFPKTTNMPITHQTSPRLTTHTSLTRPFTPSTLQTQTTFTKSTHTPYTSHTLLTKPTSTHKSSVTLHQSPSSIWKVPVTHNHKTEPRPLHMPRFPHTPKPNTTSSSSTTPTKGYSEEEEEEVEEDEKYKEMKRELLDSSQEAESKSKTKTKIHRYTGMS